VTTRVANRWLSVMVAAPFAAFACSSKPAPAPDAGVATARAACQFGAGDLPATTLADYPTGSAIPIDHIVLIMQENRTFDHYFSSLTVPGQTVNGASPTATNPDPEHPGQTISRFHQPAACFDGPNAGWQVNHAELDDGGMDGWTVQNTEPRDPSGERALGYYDGTDLPFYYSLANAFAISDSHFCSVLSTTYPNRLTYMAGTSFGQTSNVIPNDHDDAGSLFPNMFLRLNDAQVSWTFYVQDEPATIALLPDTWTNNMSHIVPLSQFYSDADAGLLSSVSWIDLSDFRGGISPAEEPPCDPQVGESYVEGVVRTLMASPNWPTSALFVTWDEGGGLYDHVDPPAACVPDDLPPILADGGPAGFTFNQYGMRTALFAVSPYAKRGYVSHQVTDHAAILRFVEARFNLPAMTHRDGNAVPPFDMFDFSSPDLTAPTLAVSIVDAGAEAMCAAAYPAP
jgi:phospholipase C